MGLFRLLCLLSLSSAAVLGNYEFSRCGGEIKKHTNKLGKHGRTKVMGGRNALPSELTYNVLLIINEQRGKVMCGATMISSRHAITAAHCFKNPRNEKISRCSPDEYFSSEQVISRTEVYVGGICYKAEDGCTKKELGAKRKIKRIEMFEQYYARHCDRGYDFALLQFDTPITVEHACLPHRSPRALFSAPEKLISFGYGVNPAIDPEKYSNRLQVVDLEFKPKRSCLPPWSHHFDDAAICTEEHEHTNVCAGDSGGGVLGKYDIRHFLYGLVSYGTDCEGLRKGTRPKTGQVNTDIRYFSSSIDKFMGDLKKLPNIDHLPGELFEYGIED